MIHSIARTALFLVLAGAASLAQATKPASGTLSPANQNLAFSGGPYIQSNATATHATVSCGATTPCDDFALTVNMPVDLALRQPGMLVRVALSWEPQQTDLDLRVYNAAGQDISGAGRNAAGRAELVQFPVQPGISTYTVRVIPYAPGGASATAVISLAQGPVAPVIGKAAASAEEAPRYTVFTPPTPFGENAGEPSVGYNKNSGRFMYLSGLQTLRGSFPETLSPPQPESCEALWEDVSYILTNTASLDPILHTDYYSGRTFVSQLRSEPAGPLLVGANSYFAFTDDDGATWSPGQLDPPEGSYDHQTVAGGPYPAALAPVLGNPLNKGSAVYYCAQAVIGLCARSDDGGMTFGRATPAYNLAVDGCGGIHGHVRVGPDGTVYLPHRDCGASQALSVSTTAGVVWTVHPVPDASVRTQLANDPSFAISSDSKTGYFCYNNADGEPMVAVTHDQGTTWDASVPIGAGPGIQESVFVEAIAGDADRAACGFVGTTTDGNPEALDFEGVWHAYIAHTYDGGKTWTTVNATPGDPIQQAGGIWLSGGGSLNRNLLDFNEISLDDKGRVIYGYADGCIGSCVPNGPNTFSSKASIVRQSGGRPLYAAHDADFPQPAAPKNACVAGRRDDLGSYLTWRKPDTGGREISGYKVFRGTTPDRVTQIGSTDGKLAFNDRGADPAVEKYYYNVIAMNSLGQSQVSNTVGLLVGPRPTLLDPCVLPGVGVVTSPTGDATYPVDAFDITSVSVAEPPGELDGKLVFTLKVVGLSTVPPGWRWAVRFSAPTPPPSDLTGAPQEDYFVAMVSSDSVAPSFTYGTTGVPNDNAPGRFFTTIGALDAGSGFDADGTITLVLDKAKIGSPAPGQPIVNILGSVRASGPTVIPGTGGTNETIADATSPGAYTLRTGDYCLPNNAPLAVLTANVTSGATPLKVNFDASGSRDPDGNDSIAEYTFNFADGSDDVTQSSPQISHSFAGKGAYPVKLLVKDSRGMSSVNPAVILILAGGAVAPVVPTDQGRFGGAPGLALLLPLLGFAVLRRRREVGPQP